jgi:uncharacterized membrane protein
MRSDVVLYIVAGLFFVLALISVVIFDETIERILGVASTVVLGILLIGLGRYQRLKKGKIPKNVNIFSDFDNFHKS